MATFTGTAGNDVANATGGGTLTGFTGGTLAQLTDAQGDTFNGLAGNDNIVSGSGDDIINGGAGNDFINAGTGNNDITGGVKTNDEKFSPKETQRRMDAALLRARREVEALYVHRPRNLLSRLPSAYPSHMASAGECGKVRFYWRARDDSNVRPLPSEGNALSS